MTERQGKIPRSLLYELAVRIMCVVLVEAHGVDNKVTCISSPHVELAACIRKHVFRLFTS
jgi:hypothetical protein